MIGWLMGLALLIKPLLMMTGLVKPAVFPQPLPEAEESACLTAMREGDRDARNRLIEHNLRLVAHVVKKFDSTRTDTDDLISIGTIGLIKAIERFEPGHGTKLATFAAKCIENEILMHLRASKKIRKDISLHEPFGTDKEGNELALIDVLGTDGEEVIDEVHLNIEKDQIRAYLPVLSGREREVICGRFGLTAGGVEKTQKELARSLGISRSYVSRIEKRALLRLYQEIQQARNPEN